MEICWTPDDRDIFVRDALTTENERGRRGPYWFNLMSKNKKPDDENESRAKVTQALMNTIFGNPEYRMIALKIYDILLEKIFSHPLVRNFYMRDVVVLLKGGMAYTYLIGGANETFPYSDLDVVIYINPYLYRDDFNNLKNIINTLVLQTISQYKRTIDHMLFLNKPNNDRFLSPETCEKFKEDYEKAISAIEDRRGAFVSPFESIPLRNTASKHSFIIADSKIVEDKVVRVEVPHFENCERIPLRKTPLFCSHNRSLSFNRTGDDTNQMKGCFDLYRIRFNNILVVDPDIGVKDEGEDKGEEPVPTSLGYESATADFIDISILGYDDIELKDFWNHGRFMNVFDAAANLWISIPDFQSALTDLHKMLNVYECPENKREKREMRYKYLLDIIGKTTTSM